MLPTLTGARFLAALGVLWVHYQYAVADSLPAWMNRLGLGTAGVSFFFVLSGFILTYNYSATFKDGISKADLTRYAVARFARIVPVYWLALIFITGCYLTAPLTSFSRTELAVSWVAHFFAIQPYFPQKWVNYPWNAPGWSIGCEIFFYALLPLVIYYLRRPWTVLICAFVLQLVTSAFITYAFPPYRFAEFLIGCCAAYIYMRGRQAPWLLPIALVCYLAIEVTHVFGVAIPRIPLQAPVFAAAIYALASGFKPLEGRLVELGDASYSLYLLHWGPLLLLMDYYGRGKAPISITILVAITCIAASVFVYRHFEVPMRAAIRSGVFIGTHKASR